MLLAAGSLAGAQLNRWMLKRGVSPSRLLAGAACVNVLACGGVALSMHHVAFVLPMTGVAMSFSMIIPCVLGSALSRYADSRGTAGAMLGLLYYLLIAMGLALAGMWQNLGEVLIVCAAVSLSAASLYASKHVRD